MAYQKMLSWEKFDRPLFSSGGSAPLGSRMRGLSIPRVWIDEVGPDWVSQIREELKNKLKEGVPNED